MSLDEKRKVFKILGNLAFSDIIGFIGDSRMSLKRASSKGFTYAGLNDKAKAHPGCKKGGMVQRTSIATIGQCNGCGARIPWSDLR